MSSTSENCLLCGGALTPVLDGLRDPRSGAPASYVIHRCKHCGAEHTLPRLEPAALQRMARLAQKAESSAQQSPGKPAGKTAFGRFCDRLRRGRFYPWWLRIDGDVSFQLARGRGRMLAVGCGDADMLARYRASGFAVEGWSPDRRAATVARDAGFTVHDGDPMADPAQFPPSQLAPGALYDVIVLANVLPLSRDPQGLLRALNQYLAPGGEFWISLPNSTSLFRDMFGRYWINWHVPFYAVHYAPSTLRHLLAENGFLVRDMACVTPALWLTQSILVGLYSWPDKPTERLDKPTLLAGWMLVLRGFFFPTLFFLNRALRGDCLVVRARRRAG